MQSSLALIICVIFVLFLLWLDHKQETDTSKILWIPTLWMLVSASRPVGGWFPSSVVDVDSGSMLDQIFHSSCLCMGLLILAWRKFDWLRAAKEQKWLVLLISYMFMSIFWSDNEIVSFKRWMKELSAVVMAFVVLTEQNPKEAMQCIFRRTIYILIPFSLVVIKYFPEFGVQYGRWSGKQTWIGVCLQKNGLGRLCMVSAFFLVWAFIRRWRDRELALNAHLNLAEVVIFILTMWLLIQRGDGYSATAIAAGCVGFSTFGILLWIKRRKIQVAEDTIMIIIAIIIVFGVITIYVGGSTVAAFTFALGRNETLTGRTELWDALTPVVLKHPIWGVGFGGFWTSESRNTYNITEGHSGYLDLLLDIGYIGLLLMSVFILSSVRKAQRELDWDFDWAALWICFLVMVAVHNIAETSLNTFTHHLLAILLFLSVSSTKLSPDRPENQNIL